MSQTPRLRAAGQDRDAVVARLQTAYAAGQLDAQELDERVDRALAARHLDDLALLAEDLPEARTPAVSTGAALPAVAAGGRTERGISIMGGRRMRPSSGTTAVGTLSTMGGNRIDLRDCTAPGTTITVDLASVMGGTRLLVGPGVRVEDKVVSIMGGHQVDDEACGDGSQGTVVCGACR